MRIEVLMVANAAGVENNLLNVQGGGWEHYSPSLFPWTVRGAVCGIFALDPDELATTRVVDVAVSDQAGHVRSSSGSMVIDATRPLTEAGVPMRFPFFAPLMFVVSGPTVVTVRLSEEEGNELGSVAFSVKEPTSDIPLSG
jgi:hypothetical protein